MNTDTAMRLADLTSNFYAKRGSSFSATRDHPWRGWEACSPYIDRLIAVDKPSCSVLDIACGNLRFLDFLAARFPSASWDYHGIDNAGAMVPTGRSIHSLDIMAALFRGDLAAELPAELVDLSVCFGFLHHVPTIDLRKLLVNSQINHTRPGGLAILTAWQFALDPARRDKAAATTARALDRLNLSDLEDGDYLLGWHNSEDALRYCHSFSDAEIDELVATVTDRARPIARFQADGRSGAMNTYLVLQTP